MLFTIIGGKFKFQVQDSDLEYFFLESWKTHLTFWKKATFNFEFYFSFLCKCIIFQKIEGFEYFLSNQEAVIKKWLVKLKISFFEKSFQTLILYQRLRTWFEDQNIFEKTFTWWKTLDLPKENDCCKKRGKIWKKSVEFEIEMKNGLHDKCIFVMSVTYILSI